MAGGDAAAGADCFVATVPFGMLAGCCCKLLPLKLAVVVLLNVDGADEDADTHSGAAADC